MAGAWISISAKSKEGHDLWIGSHGRNVTTDAQGNFSFPNMPSGAYTLVVTKRGSGRAHLDTVTIETSTDTKDLKIVLPNAQGE